MGEENRSTMKARPYQLELVDHLCEHNGVLYLPTGAGKTFVAILVLKRLSLNLYKPLSNGGKRSIFMCNTVELARQQCVEIRKCTNLTVGLYIGERDVDSWVRKQWQTEIEQNQVLVGTAQIFVDIVTQNYLKLSDINLVIIDECHHATKNHPMHTFLSLFQNMPSLQQPRFIGLTGVLIKGNKLNAIDKELRNLEACFRGNIVTVRDTNQFHNVMIYSTKPKEQMLTYNSGNHVFKVETQIKAIVDDWKSIIDRFDIGTVTLKLTKGLSKQREPNKKKVVKNLIDDFMYQMNDFGLYTASLAIMSLIVEFEVKKRQAESTALRNLYRYCVTRCELIRHLLVKEFKTMLDEEDGCNNHIKDNACNTIDVILNYSSQKMSSFLRNLTTTFKGKQKNDVTCLIFVQRRYTAKCVFYVLQNYIKECPELKDVIIPQFMVGRQNIAYSIESVLDKKWNINVMQQFRQNECNLVVCSSVLEEGIDVQACNYVFVLDELSTFNSYIQTKGRARSKTAFYTIFSKAENSDATVQKIQTYKKAHEEIRKFLITRVLNCDEPDVDEVAQQFTSIIPPFKISSGAQLVATSALSLLNRYCQALPWDIYGCVLPWFYKLSCINGCQVQLQLPLQSLLKETITSDIMQNAKEAKISAAFKACVKLYQLGELNDNFLPISKTECIQKVSDDLFKNWEKYKNKSNAKSIDKSVYDKLCPIELYDALPKVGQKCYAYRIQFYVDFENNPYNAHVVRYLNTSSTFAILLSKTLPKLAEMPLFMSQGKIRVQVANEPIECVVHTDHQLECLKGFHIMLFRDLLELWKNFLVIDRRNKENAYLIVPINSIKTIDWNLVENFQRLVPCRSYSIIERSRKVYRAEDFLDKVVTKWYNEVENERFVVTKVRHDLNPLSSFENKQFKNYAEFYETRYHVTLSNTTQFLLEVKALTKRRNFFINAMGKSKEIKKDCNNIILIPELCHNFNFPANLWLKALFLPTILHRVYYMLHAEALRQRINTYLALNKHFQNYKPHALVVDSSLKRAVDNDGIIIKKDEKNKKYLTSLSPKLHVKELEIQKLNSVDVPWKEYMEPVDHTRRLNNVFPLEIDYYYNFINGLVTDIEQMRLTEEDIYSKSQLELPTCYKENAVTRNSLLLGGAIKKSPLAIENVPQKDKYHLEIMEISFKHISDIKSAEQHEFLAAITTAAVNDVFDMERFELLGDAFLKFSVSLYLANKYPMWNEGYLTTIKGRAVSNRNLMYCMLEMDIYRRICGSVFSPNISWLPPMAALPSNLLELLLCNNDSILSTLSPNDFYSLNLTEEEIQNGSCHTEKLTRFAQKCQTSQEMGVDNIEMNIDNDMNMYLYKELLRDKVVADTLEAILGVCVKNYGIHRTFKMLEFFGIVQPDPGLHLGSLLDLKLNINQRRNNIENKDVDSLLANNHILQKNLGYSFIDRTYLLQALTHPSNPTNRLTGCYQELEFLGDAILDMLVTCYIFERFQNLTPGKMTDMRMALVNNITLGCVCVRHRFHQFMLYENASLTEAIKTFDEFQKTQNYRVTDQVRILMEEEKNNYSESETDSSEDDADADVNSFNWTDKNNYNLSTNVDVPKALGDIVEALIAAVYLDCRDLQITWRVIYNLLEPEILEFSREVPLDPFRQLMENKLANATFSKPIENNGVSMVKCVFNCMDKSVEVNGFGSNIKSAKKAAAKHALRILAKRSN